MDWQIGGVTHLDLDDEGLLEIVPTDQIQDGEWGAWILYFNATGAFLTETNILPFTDSVAVFSTGVNSLAPAGAEEYILRFRVREAVGDGFSFTQISATAVPEPSSALLILIGMGGLLMCRRKSSY